MTAEQFEIFWSSTYPDTIPISHYFRYDFNDRWFRIHSLPESKRYAENETDWNILLDRQNKIITDIIGENSKVIIVTGDFYYEGHIELHPITDSKSITDMSFISLDNIDLHKISPYEYDQGQIYRPIISEQIWQANKFNNLLIEIADEKLSAFFISLENKSIIAPYDGGIDIILNDSEAKKDYKEKYKDWLSERQDGL
jgi:hypothetical protein